MRLVGETLALIFRGGERIQRRRCVELGHNKDFPQGEKKTLAAAKKELWPEKSLVFNELARTETTARREATATAIIFGGLPEIKTF